MTRRHVCERPRDRDWDVDDDDVEYWVALRNGIYFPACFSCWFKWPDEHKRWPATGYGLVPVYIDRRVQVLQETA